MTLSLYLISGTILEKMLKFLPKTKKLDILSGTSFIKENIEVIYIYLAVTSLVGKMSGAHIIQIFTVRLTDRFETKTTADKAGAAH